MTDTPGYKRRIVVVSVIVAGVVALAYGGWVTWMNHVTFASDADCRLAQAVVKEGDALTDVAAEKSWAPDARTRTGNIRHRRLRAGVRKYIAVVDGIFAAPAAGPAPAPDAKNDAFSDMWDACRFIEVNYPTPRSIP